MKINAEAIVARWELTKQDTDHPAYIIAKAMIDHDIPSPIAIDMTRDWMYMEDQYTGSWSWADVQAVLDLYTEVSE